MFQRGWMAIKKMQESLQSLFLLVIRLYWGYQFAITGFGKLMNPQQAADFFHSLGIPFPELNAVLAGSMELFGGICLFLGLFSRFISIPLLFVMLMAYVTAGHASLVTLFTEFDPDPFFHDTAFLFAYATLLIFLFGPGKYSVDYWLTGTYKTKQMP